ncbi:envelope stress response membrane protein PspB [Allosphingosinicella sp.]|uniref:envelope stress response membrane protein PspB n=1 Tax=Allosphingosinicella sp. TaxID=2823234 RepID=UPI003784949C
MNVEIIIPIFAIVSLFILLPWLVFHYVTKWKAQATLTTEDENLLDELHELARRLDDRMQTIERIIDAENPGWRHLGQDPVEDLLEDRTDRLYEVAERTNRPARTRRKS